MNEYFGLRELPKRYQKVRTKVEFSGVPVGSIGTVVDHYQMGKGQYGVTIRWSRSPGDKLEDGFSKSDYALLEEV